MKMTKREVVILVCEVVCCFLPSILARVLVTLIKNYARNTNDKNFDEIIKIQLTKNIKVI